MQADPCTVCEGTDLKLIDGFYYCVECGTQNANVRETVVEQKALGDGTFALSTKRKIVKLHDSNIQMSEEWYKWHTYNFILLGLADELVAVGAKPTFKTKLLWIWTRYIKKYQNKYELGLAKKPQDGIIDNVTLPSFMVEENSSSNLVPDGQDSELYNTQTIKKTSNKNVIMDGSRRDIRFISKGLIIAMLYLALNLDSSDIQLSHIYRFLKEKRLNLSNLQRFVPEEIPVKSITQWMNFTHSRICNMHQVRALAMSLLIKLDLGTPKVPDLRKFVHNFLTELCLPNDMKPLIYSLMHFYRCDFLDINNRTKKTLVRLPDYEAVVMSYVVVAIKMCFGLDNDYEERLSNAIEKINLDKDLPKSHKIGKYSEPSTRLFSFKEWCSYLQFRKITLCKCCLHMADQHYLDIDDYVYMEHLEKRPENNKELQDETAMDLINKLPVEHEGRVIPKELFIPTLTPMTEYTDIIIEHSQDPETRFLLSEDFTQYSLKYACQFLNLVDLNTENIIKGVSENRKIISNLILGKIVTKKSKSEMVYVKNCENRNWMKTNPPTMEHVICDEPQNESSNECDETPHEINDKCDESQDESNDKCNESQDESNDKCNESQHESNDKSNESQHESNDKESDHGYDSEIASNEKESYDVTNDNITTETDKNTEKDKKHLIITEEDDDKNIFDDTFEELNLKDEIEQNDFVNLDVDEEDPQRQHNKFPNDDLDSLSNTSDTDITYATFNPDTFDRERTIKELIIYACKKYKITIPAEYRTKEPRKRKTDMFGNEAGPSAPKKRSKTNRGESKKKIEELLNSYYNNLQSDFLNKMQQEVSMAIRNTQLDDMLNVSQNETINQPNIGPANSTVEDALERSSICTDIMENQSNINLQNNTLVRNSNINMTNQNHINNETMDEIDETLESKLFEEGEEMEFDDLIPKGDPKYDEEKYDINQLYIRIKTEKEKDFFDLPIDPKIEEILDRKIEQCKHSTEFLEIKPQSFKTKYESDSEDEIPLNVLQDEKKMIEEMMTREESFEPLINNENVPEFKYWFRHYDKDFMLRSLDWHEKFDEELRENTPSSFYFVLQECAAILNCSTFYLYKHMQRLEQYIIARAENPN